jgi:hypothetical protein
MKLILTEDKMNKIFSKFMDDFFDLTYRTQHIYRGKYITRYEFLSKYNVTFGTKTSLDNNDNTLLFSSTDLGRGIKTKLTMPSQISSETSYTYWRWSITQTRGPGPAPLYASFVQAGEFKFQKNGGSDPMTGITLSANPSGPEVPGEVLSNLIDNSLLLTSSKVGRANALTIKVLIKVSPSPLKKNCGPSAFIPLIITSRIVRRTFCST